MTDPIIQAREAAANIDRLVEKYAKAVKGKLNVPDEIVDQHFREFAAEVLAIQASSAETDRLREVPREPTEEMLDAYWHQSGESQKMRFRTHDRARHYWQAMYDAALASLPASEVSK